MISQNIRDELHKMVDERLALKRLLVALSRDDNVSLEQLNATGDKYERVRNRIQDLNKALEVIKGYSDWCED